MWRKYYEWNRQKQWNLGNPKPSDSEEQFNPDDKDSDENDVNTNANDINDKDSVENDMKKNANENDTIRIQMTSMMMTILRTMMMIR